MRKLILLLALVPGLLLAQRGTYTVERKTSLSASAETITVQLGSAVGVVRSVGFVTASVYCSVACEVTLERDGTLATTTAITPQKVNPEDNVVTATAYRSSNVGSGATIGRQILGAGALMVFDLHDVGLTAGKNFSIKTDSITGTVVINIKWKEW
jgi:hypothetical protein